MQLTLLSVSHLCVMLIDYRLLYAAVLALQTRLELRELLVVGGAGENGIVVQRSRCHWNKIVLQTRDEILLFAGKLILQGFHCFEIFELLFLNEILELDVDLRLDY